MKVLSDLLVHPSRVYARRDPARVTTVVIHHSGSFSDTPHSMARFHVLSRNWAGIAYHYVIMPDGQSFKTNPIGVVTYHARGANKRSIGVCCVGNYEESTPSPETIQALKELLAKIRLVMPQVQSVLGHKEVKGSQTSCPGKFLMEVINELRIV